MCANGSRQRTSCELVTTRLRLREWNDADLEPFAAINADPHVMAHFVAPLSRAQSDIVAARIRRHFDVHGFGLWAVEIPGHTSFAGVVGLSVPAFEAHFTPCIEIGWRLGSEYWGRGYAFEGAAAAMQFGFERLGLREIVAFTVPANTRSRRLMARLDMTHHEGDDFDHPGLPTGHRLRRHVLYRRAAQ
jgi:RimJ/RimL family protein N-acetyltransferase